MMSFKMIAVGVIVLFVILSVFLIAETPAGGKEASEEIAEHGEKSAGKDTLFFALKAFAAAIAIGVCAASTAYAQARIGTAGMGTMAEKPELSGRVMLLVAIPETLVILGFVIAALILN